MLLSRADPKAPLPDKITWLHAMVTWLRSPVRADERAKMSNRGSGIQTVRIRFMLHLLERNPNWRANVAGVLRSILRETSALELFSSTGLTVESGFFGEASNRIMRKILPVPANERDLSALFTLIFDDPTDADWVANLPPEIFARIAELVTFGEEKPETIFLPMRKSMADALLILSPNACALGMSHDLRARMSSTQVEDSPFRALANRYQNIPRDPIGNPIPEIFTATKVSPGGIEIEQCRERIKDVYQHLEEAGVSISIVFKLEALSATISRIETLSKMLDPDPSENRMQSAQQFLAELIRQSLLAASLRSLIRTNLDMLSRKIVERVGASGEHYITTTKSEYWEMFKAGAGGGILTVGTTILKFVIGKYHMPLFFEGLFLWINYSGSFLLMQSMHFALATKQPSMTASALANKLKLLSHRRDIKEFVDEVANISRSQFAAALGNVGLVIPCALLFDFAVMQVTGHHVLSAEYGGKFIGSINPFTSITIPAAALTGVLLWLSSVTGGWIENWAFYRRLPEAIESQRRLLAVFGVERTKRFAQWFSREIAAIGSNLAIGFYLAFTPIIGQFFGLPLDVRHVTLSSGALTFSVAGIGWENLDKVSFANACLGIVIILILNFGVSFSLAMFVAIRARRIKRAWVHHLILSVGERLRRRTREFFFPTNAKS